MQHSYKESPVAGSSAADSTTGSLTIQEWLTTEEAASYLGLSVGALRNATSNGQIPHYKLGKRNRYRTTELRELLLSQRRGGLRGN